jgi:hypothetical protein
VNRVDRKKNYREGSRQLPELRLPELASWYERVAVPSVLARSPKMLSDATSTAGINQQ